MQEDGGIDEHVDALACCGEEIDEHGHREVCPLVVQRDQLRTDGPCGTRLPERRPQCVNVLAQGDEGTATMPKMPSDTDARTDEYATYAPSRQTCPECEEPFGSLEVCRRGTVERQSGPPAVVYRHPKCAEPYRRDR
ncbi:hypothetical protein GCM10010363_05140 [Streptomyces omiyaensis]|nr:hypothetical protein GCM10010363_05140 [Streptomyces omiyaensis]